MTKTSLSLSGFTISIAVFFAVISFFSCNNSGDIPFPEKKLGFSQPVTTPLVFSKAKKLQWDTARNGGISPVIKELDIDALPSLPYDSTGFKPFAQPPEEIRFDFNKLPEKDFSLDKLSSQSLELKFFALPPPTTIKSLSPVPQKGKPLSIFDFGQAQGMRAKFISALYKDKSGILWIGSREGLFSYDGDHFQTFISGSASFPPISAIIEDNKGNIWFTQATGGISVINLKNGTIGSSNVIGPAVNDISKLTMDDAGNIWVYNFKDGAVSIIDPVTKTYKNLDKKSGLSDSAAFQVFQDDNKNIWITTNTGINIIDASGKIKYFGRTNGLSSDSIRAITKEKGGQIWISTPTGLNAIDTKKGIIKNYAQLQGLTNAFSFNLEFDDNGNLWRTTSNGIQIINVRDNKIRDINTNDGLSANLVIAFAADNYYRMWIGTTSGLNIIDQNGETVHPLGTRQIISLMEDGANNLWVATAKGLFIVNPQRTVMHLLDKSSGLSDNFVQSFWNKNGNMMVATDGGYDIIDPINKTLLKAGKKEGLVSDTIYVAFKDDSGNMWLTGPSKGIFLLDFAKKIILHTDVTGGLNDDAIVDAKQDKDGLIWLATQHNGIDILNPADGTVKYLNNQPGLKDTCARMILEDKYGRMWIGTNKGIYVADTKKGTLTNITTKQGLTTNTVLSLLEYNGNILVNTNNKISIINAPGPEDSAKDWQVSLLDKSQGLLKEESQSWSTDAVTHDGKYLWGDLGLTVINQIKASSVSLPTYVTGMNVMGQPQYFLSSSGDTIYSGQAKFKWDSVSGPYNLPINLILPHNENYLQFQFSQANLSRPDTTFYTYILEGIDKNWSAVTTNTSTENYLNLPAGKYKFKVSSKGIDGKWGKPAMFKFTITPPWYQRWWAYTLYILLGLGLLRLYIVYRSRMLQKENRILEEKVKHRTEQLQKSLEDLKSTQSQLIQSEKMASLGELTAGIAHEIQNPLNFVNNFSEVNTELVDELKEELHKTNLSPEQKLPIEQLAEDIKSNQEKISFHGKRADSIVKGMLQHSRSTNGQKEMTNINTLADEYLRLAYHGLRAKDKSFNATMKTDFDESVGKISVVPQDIGRVILNLITNAFYAVTEKKKTLLSTNGGAEYEPTVSVSTKAVKQSSGRLGVIITVGDNGNGVPQKVLDKIFQPFFTTKPSGIGTGLGLSLSYDIIKAHGGELKVNTKEGEGAEFTIILPA